MVVSDDNGGDDNFLLCDLAKACWAAILVLAWCCCMSTRPKQKTIVRNNGGPTNPACVCFGVESIF